jgi:hypothetical protein
MLSDCNEILGSKQAVIPLGSYYKRSDRNYNKDMCPKEDTKLTASGYYIDALKVPPDRIIQRHIDAISSAIDISTRPLHKVLWQMLGGAHILAGRDCFVITATGSGKTLVYQCPLLASESAAIMLVCPLISLMEDQVKAGESLGLRAECLHADALSNDPKIIDRVVNGQYNVVLVSPEFCSPDNRAWMRMTTDCKFRTRLIFIVIDEAHLCHS